MPSRQQIEAAKAALAFLEGIDKVTRGEWIPVNDPVECDRLGRALHDLCPKFKEDERTYNVFAYTAATMQAANVGSAGRETIHSGRTYSSINQLRNWLRENDAPVVVDIPAAIRRGEYTFGGCADIVERYGDEITCLRMLLTRAVAEGWTVRQIGDELRKHEDKRA